MIDYMNPFEYEAANKLTVEKIIDFYIEDHNYSRFIRSKRNIFLVGERGTGKTMTLLYNSLPVQLKLKKKIDIICVYIPCNTPLTHRLEYQLLERFQASVISEHFLVVSILYHIAETLYKVEDFLGEFDSDLLKFEIEFALNIEIPSSPSFFNSLMLAFQRELRESQKTINSNDPKAFYNSAISFSSGVITLLSCLKKIPSIQGAHFALMLDDAHDLNEYQIRSLNSWIAYRDNTLFSFKIAKTKVDNTNYKTVSGGTILEGHDFTLIDMEQPFQNKYSEFGMLARKVIKKRLLKMGIEIEPEDFFPEHSQFVSDINQFKEIVKTEALAKFPNASPKQIQDHVYKYARARYFASRASGKANRPPYSGLDMIIHISTGVLRNLLEPCYRMYDRVYSSSGNAIICEIPPKIQNEIIMERSKAKWDWLRDGLDTNIEGCSRDQATHLYQLFDKLAILFRERLLKHPSEPRAITFTISNKQHPRFNELEKLLQIARKAQLLYTYSSSAKDLGSRETYYVPNRILWPDRGLDPHGQHARVSILSDHLFDAACENKIIPFVFSAESLTKAEQDTEQQGDLFDGKY